MFDVFDFLQKSCVHFVLELGDKPLIFVLKMDEAEIVKHQKMERVSVTLMNRALHEPQLSKEDPRYFSVQAEGDIWPVGTFQVFKETHSCLKWVFEQTPLPFIISAQQQGEKLTVPDVGDFKVEWHLAADMKTIKCLYGFAHGAMQSILACIVGRGVQKRRH